MPRLSMTDVARVAKGAGFSGRDLTVAVAVAYAESDGKTDAVGDGGKSIGLWQIHMPSHPGYSRAQLMDPAVNARAARAIASSGRGWSNWTQYRLGIYMLYMAQAEVAAQRVEPKGGILAGPAQAGTHLPDASAGIGSTTEGLGQLVEAVGNVGMWVSTPANWLRVAYVVVGGMLIVGALVVLSLPVVTPAAKAGLKVAKAVA